MKGPHQRRSSTVVQRSRVAIDRYPVTIYVVLVVAFSWTVWLVGIPGTSGPEQLVVVLAGAWGPTIVAIVIVAFRDGWAGIRHLLGRLARWRTGARWYAASVLLVPGVALTVTATASVTGRPLPPVTTPGDLGLIALPVVFAVNAVVGGPLAEELGWRGFMLPHLAERIGGRGAAIGVGVVWALWHLPFFTLASGLGVTAGFPLWAYVPVVVAWSVLVSWIVVNTNGSVLVAVLFHASVNTTLGTLGIVDPTNTELLVGFVLAQVGLAGLVAWITGADLGRTN